MTDAIQSTLPRTKWRRIFLIGLMILFILLIVGGLVIVSRTGWETATATRDLYLRLEPETAFTDVSFPSRGRSYPVYAFLQKGDPDRPAVINVHGYRASRFSDFQLERAQEIVDLGYTVLTIDLSDNGGQTVDDSRISFGDGERYDVLGAYDYLIEQGFSPEKIGLVGESMGGTTVLLAAQVEPRIRAIWADSPYSDAIVVIREQSQSYGYPPVIVDFAMLWAGYLPKDDPRRAVPLRSGSALAAAKQAVYLLTCEQDTTVLPHHARDLYTRYMEDGVNVQFWQIGCLSHATGRSFTPDEYTAQLDTFLKTHLE